MKKIKQTIALILSVLLLMGMLTSLAFAGVDNPFDDVGKKDWFAPYVLSLYADGIVNGKTTATFDPQANVTRAEFVKMLGAISMVNAKRFAPKGLTDVKAKDWYAGFVAWAIEEGVTNGTSPTTFAPNDNITREQMATMIHRFAESNAITLPEGKVITFKDGDQIAKYAKAAVAACQKGGIIGGVKVEDGYVFKPADNATRAEAAKMLCVLFDIIKDTDRYQAYVELKSQLQKHANKKNSENLPLFESQLDSHMTNFIELTTQNGTEQIRIGMKLTQTLTEPIKDLPDVEVGDPIEISIHISLSALGDEYIAALDESLDTKYYANIRGKGKPADFFDDDKPLYDMQLETNVPKNLSDQFKDEFPSLSSQIKNTLAGILQSADFQTEQGEYLFPMFGFPEDSPLK